MDAAITFSLTTYSCPHKVNKGRHQKKNCRFGENCTIGGEGVRKIIEFSSFTNDEKHGRGGGLRVTFHYFIEPNYD